MIPYAPIHTLAETERKPHFRICIIGEESCLSHYRPKEEEKSLLLGDKMEKILSSHFKLLECK